MKMLRPQRGWLKFLQAPTTGKYEKADWNLSVGSEPMLFGTAAFLNQCVKYLSSIIGPDLTSPI